MGLFDLDFSKLSTNLLPANKRKPIFQAWFFALLSPLQWLRNAWFDAYDVNEGDALYDNGTTYSIGDRVAYTDNAVYECQVNGTVGVPPDPSNRDTIWWLVSPDYRGVQNRVLFNSQRLNFETVINQFFRTTYKQPPLQSDIYIGTNQLNNFVFIVGVDEGESSRSFALEQFCSQFIIDDYDFDGDAFTIYVPESGGSPLPGFYSSLQPGADAKIRNVADKLVIAGIKYNITTY